MKKNIIKKVLLSVVLATTILVWIFNVQATYYNLPYHQKVRADRFVNNIYNSMKDPCGGNYTNYQNRINNLDNYANYFWKNSRMYRFIKYSTQELTKKCTVFQEDNLFDSIGFEYTWENIKKWNFVKNIGGWVDARKNKLYTYFYYWDILINTVKNKIKNDKYLVYWYDYNGCYGDNYLTNYYIKRKIALYSASTKYPLVFFSKKTDFGTQSYIYNLETRSWED